MSVKSPHEQRVDWWARTIRCLLHAMNRHDKQLASDLIISGFIVGLAITEGANPTVSVAALTIINTITVSQVLAEFRRIQTENRQQYSEQDQ